MHCIYCKELSLLHSVLLRFTIVIPILRLKCLNVAVYDNVCKMYIPTLLPCTVCTLCVRCLLVLLFYYQPYFTTLLWHYW